MVAGWLARRAAAAPVGGREGTYILQSTVRVNELTHRGGVDLETYFDMGYLQSKLTVDLSCVNVLVRPTRARVSPRQSGAARPCSKYPSGGVQGKRKT